MFLSKSASFIKKNGFTLVEVLASIVLLSILILSVFAIFTNTTNSTKMAENIVDATYVGQTSMEELYGISLTTTFENRNMALQSMGYQTISQYSYDKIDPKSNFYIELTLEQHVQYNNLSFVTLKVFKHKNGQLQAQMENVLIWQGVSS